MPLKASQKKHLRTLCHHLRPIVTVAAKGLSGAVIAEIERALADHELIKLKLRGDRGERATWCASITAQCHAERIQSIGQVACFYRRNPDKPVIDLP